MENFRCLRLLANGQVLLVAHELVKHNLRHLSGTFFNLNYCINRSTAFELVNNFILRGARHYYKDKSSQKCLNLISSESVLRLNLLILSKTLENVLPSEHVAQQNVDIAECMRRLSLVFNADDFIV